MWCILTAHKLSSLEWYSDKNACALYINFEFDKDKDWKKYLNSIQHNVIDCLVYKMDNTTLDLKAISRERYTILIDIYDDMFIYIIPVILKNNIVIKRNLGYPIRL